MIDKNITLDRTRTSCLKPELVNGITHGDLLTPEIINDIASGDLLSASKKIDIITGGVLSSEQKESILTGGLLSSVVKKDIDTGGLLLAELKSDILTGDLLSAKSKVGILTGNLISAMAKEQVSTGLLLTPEPLPSNSNFPLNYARICYDNTLLNGSASATSDDLKSGNMLTPSTYDKWRPVLDPSSCVLIGNSKLCDYVGIAAHNLSGSSVVVSISDGGASTEVYNGIVPSNSPLLIRFAESTYDRVFIDISGTTTAEVGVVYLGKELAMMRPNYSGYSPATFSSKDSFTPQRSDGGQFLGKQLVKKGFGTQASFSHLTYEWYESEFSTIRITRKKIPLFLGLEFVRTS